MHQIYLLLAAYSLMAVSVSAAQTSKNFALVADFYKRFQKDISHGDEQIWTKYKEGKLL